MQIVSSQISQYAQHQQSRSERLRLEYRAPPAPPPAPASTSTASAPSEVAESSDTDRQGLSANLQTLLTLLEHWLGHKIELPDLKGLGQAPASPESAAAPATTQASGNWSLSYRLNEQESASYQTSGVIRTQDGREIQFDASLTLARSYSLTITAGQASSEAAGQRTDPLVINYAAPAATLSGQTFAFDLNQDGKVEQISQLAPGSAFLALDRNQDGRINHGGELFGPASGDSYAELARYDDDHNGWIDHGDAVYGKLVLLLKSDSKGDELRSLESMGIGAILLQAGQADFKLTDSNNRELGMVRKASIFLYEDGRVGTSQHIDLTA